MVQTRPEGKRERASARHRVAVIICSDTDSPEGRARVANALSVARQFSDTGDTVAIIFDGAGTAAAAALADPSHRSHRRLKAVWDEIAGACPQCAADLGVQHRLAAAGIPLLAECGGHPNLGQRMVDGYTVLIF